MSGPITPAQIDALLPQTQCGLCGFKGCMPYAIALAENKTSIDLCPPGGVPGLLALGELLKQDVSSHIEAMEKKTLPAQIAVIREAECIGCTKCIQSCPVDAILGSGKNMHTVIAVECTGCELCIAPCPVDCIDIIAVSPLDRSAQKQKADLARERFIARNQRLARQPATRASQTPEMLSQASLADKKAFIEAALLRTKSKRN